MLYFWQLCLQKREGNSWRYSATGAFPKIDVVPRSGGGLTCPKIFCLQCDISKYFDSINHEIILDLIKRKISDGKTIWLIEEILNSSQESPGTGIPIGNLTSQLFANIYLNELDQFIKHGLRARYYIRYMDDFLFLNFDKRELCQIKGEIREFSWLHNLWKLSITPKKYGKKIH